MYALLPDLKFTCDATLTKWWFIGRFSDVDFVDSNSNDRTSLLVMTPSGDDKYLSITPEDSVLATNLMDVITHLILIENEVLIPVHMNDVISIVQPPMGYQMLYERGKGSVGYFRRELDRINMTNIFRTSSNAVSMRDYPLLAVETGRLFLCMISPSGISL